MLSHCILTNIIGYAVLYYLIGNDLFTHKLVIVVTLSFSLIASIIPTALVHIQYKMENRGGLFIVDSDRKKVSYNSAKIKIEKNIDEIDYIQYVCYYNKYDEGLYSFTRYKYFKIVFKDNAEIIITCLMMSEIKNTIMALFKSVEIRTTTRLVAFIY